MPARVGEDTVLSFLFPQTTSHTLLRKHTRFLMTVSHYLSALKGDSRSPYHLLSHKAVPLVNDQVDCNRIEVKSLEYSLPCPNGSLATFRCRPCKCHHDRITPIFDHINVGLRQYCKSAHCHSPSLIRCLKNIASVSQNPTKSLTQR